MRRTPSGLRVESLESRDTPATFGVPWPDGDHLSLSLAPSNTPIGGRANALPELLAQLGSQARLDVLRAFQSWAAHANVNFGLAADDGSAFGVGGANQGDPRFGDIRVGGIPLAADVLAVTAPYALFDNYSGDVTVNTAAGYGPGGPDLYTALLQESGHALGIGNSPNPSSAMYEYYGGPRGGLSADDVAAVQALYGPRVPDRFERTGGNATLRSATAYAGPLSADITTADDVDVYRFTTGLLTRSAVVSLQAAGMSLLTAKVELLDANGNVVRSLLATDPTTNDVTVTLNGVRPLSTYYVRVSAAQDNVFGVGAYDLAVTQQSLLTDVTGLVGGLLSETGLNDTLATATGLLSQTAAVGPRTEYVVQGGFGSASDVDYYRITVPPAADGAPVNLLATVWGQHGATLNPWVEGYDAFGHPLATEVFTADGNTNTVQIRGVAPGRTYFLKVASDSHATGNYTLAADLRTDAAALPTGPAGTLDAATPTADGDLTLAQTGQVHFILTADGAAAGRGVVVTVTAADGTVVAQLPAAVGRSRSADVLLAAGAYSVRATTLDATSPVRFRLGMAIVSDPIGATPIDTTGTPQPTSPTPPPAQQPPPVQPPPPDAAPGEDPADDDDPPANTPPPTTTAPPYDCGETATWY